VLALLANFCAWFEPMASVSDRRDAKDNIYLDLMLAVDAPTLVSSDDDLLVLNPWRDRHIPRPAACLATVRA
jgi:predicted nucleic acid-binding protein